MEEEKEEVQEKTDAEKREEEYEALKAANDKVQEELLRREQLKAKIDKGGQSFGGEVKVEVKEETPEEYKDKIMSGENGED
jgi:hypothetical protein